MALDANIKSVNFTSSVQLKNGGGFIYGIIVNSHSSGTLKLWNSLTAALDGSITPQSEGLIIDTMTFAAGFVGAIIFPSPLPFKNGLFATVGGTLNAQAIITRN